MTKCAHKNITKNEECNTVTTFYRRIGKKYVYDGSSSGRTGVVKWLCLDCEEFIPSPKDNEISKGNGTILSGHKIN